MRPPGVDGAQASAARGDALEGLERGPRAGAVSLIDKWAMITWAIETRPFNALAELKLFTALIDMAGVTRPRDRSRPAEPDLACTSLGVLATASGMARSSVQRALLGLVKLGLIANEPSRGRRGGCEVRIIGLAGAHGRLGNRRWRDATKDRNGAGEAAEMYRPVGSFPEPEKYPQVGTLNHEIYSPVGTFTAPETMKSTDGRGAKSTDSSVHNPPIESSQGVSTAYVESAEREDAIAGKPARPPPRGTRLPSDWPLTAALRDFAQKEGFDERSIEGMHDQFCDYWRAAAGPNARKCDWLAAWRNWVRREARARRPSGNGAGPHPGSGGAGGYREAGPGSRAAAAAAVIAARRRRAGGCQ